MAQGKMTQSQIQALINDSDLQSSAFKQPDHVSNHNFQQSKLTKKSNKHQQSNEYGGQEFQDFQQSKPIQNISNNFKKDRQQKKQKSSFNQSYANQQFQSYQQSKRAPQFQQSGPQPKFNKKIQTKQLKPIQELSSNQKGLKKQNLQYRKPALTKIQGNKQINKNLIVTSKQKPKQKLGIITNSDFVQNKNLAYNYNRLQQRQKQLLLTTLSQENKNLKFLLSEKDKQISIVKSKYNILLQQKAQVLGNAKQATLKKQLQIIQSKYDALLKQKAKQRAYKTVTMPLSKTITNNFVSQTQAEQREQQLLVIIQKLKQRLVSTDKQLKTLQQKMNQGLDYQEQLQRKLKRVQQLQLRIQKMKNQAQEDRALIQMLKQKSKQQKSLIEQLQQQKNSLNISLKRAEMAHATQSDLKDELQEVRRQKQLLQKSLRQISVNFSSNMVNKKMQRPQIDDMIQDSNQLLRHKK